MSDSEHPLTEALSDFSEKLSDHEDKRAAELLYYSYDSDGNDGSAFGVYRLNGELWEFHGSHCSCHGLEEQFDPEQTTEEALLMRPNLPEELRDKLSLSELIPKLESPKKDPNIPPENLTQGSTYFHGDWLVMTIWKRTIHDRQD